MQRQDRLHNYNNDKDHQDYNPHDDDEDDRPNQTKSSQDGNPNIRYTLALLTAL
ncbi:hypothetical protein BS50DRAFT_578441 [Corynespora cassiicola Philippines]|uniref:Uncharacterized protein n=1 Tax=Corynespora cassiicola Philippines TaxID=1448308 RepID=A0A2T2N7L3_CORCC|nr:hypothetical protein BS50DRAFT_578441 [Corynespora cassiicola Philippines]